MSKITIKPTKARVLTAFVNQMIKDKGLAELDEAHKAELRSKLMKELDAQIERACILAMSDAQLIQVNELLDAGASDEEIWEVFETANINYEVVAAQTMRAFRMNFLKEAA